jgi:transcriptional regulator with XRE-family HTH domain
VRASFGEEAGKALRRARLARGLTLRQVAALSGNLMKPTAVASYERSERGISLRRFCVLAEFYQIRPELLLAEIMSIGGEEPPTTVDLTSFENDEPDPHAAPGPARRSD